MAAKSAAIDDSDDDDYDATQDADDLVSRVLHAYADADGRLKASSALHEFLQTGNNVCLICLDTIKHGIAVRSVPRSGVPYRRMKCPAIMREDIDSSQKTGRASQRFLGKAYQ